MENIYIIGDVHGCYKSLIALIDKLPNKEKSKICFVGDLVDRGMYSYEVVKFVMENNYDCVLGNHE
ncbi:metallophosphoesterase [Aliarcobacter butzleri]|nr:metallophosphoesterase [Aliarcobacter butzleri]MCT7603919.1 metallophosphoesterase [Aliarcobacter butzleri]